MSDSLYHSRREDPRESNACDAGYNGKILPFMQTANNDYISATSRGQQNWKRLRHKLQDLYHTHHEYQTGKKKSFFAVPLPNHDTQLQRSFSQCFFIFFFYFFSNFKIFLKRKYSMCLTSCTNDVEHLDKNSRLQLAVAECKWTEWKCINRLRSGFWGWKAFPEKLGYFNHNQDKLLKWHLASYRAAFVPVSFVGASMHGWRSCSVEFLQRNNFNIMNLLKIAG